MTLAHRLAYATQVCRHTSDKNISSFAEFLLGEKEFRKVPHFTICSVSATPVRLAGRNDGHCVACLRIRLSKSDESQISPGATTLCTAWISTPMLCTRSANDSRSCSYLLI